MFEESRENTGGVIAGMLRSLEDGHLDIVPSAELKKRNWQLLPQTTVVMRSWRWPVTLTTMATKWYAVSSSPILMSRL